MSSQSTPESWAQNSHDNIVNAQHQLMASIQLRSLIDSILTDTARDMREQADVVETEFGRRIAQMADAMQKMTHNMREVRSTSDHSVFFNRLVCLDVESDC
jgi:tektin-4